VILRRLLNIFLLCCWLYQPPHLLLFLFPASSGGSLWILRHLIEALFTFSSMKRILRLLIPCLTHYLMIYDIFHFFFLFLNKLILSSSLFLIYCENRLIISYCRSCKLMSGSMIIQSAEIESTLHWVSSWIKPWGWLLIFMRLLLLYLKAIVF
jgi:hypothetical protein